MSLVIAITFLFRLLPSGIAIRFHSKFGKIGSQFFMMIFFGNRIKVGWLGSRVCILERHEALVIQIHTILLKEFQLLFCFREVVSNHIEW